MKDGISTSLVSITKKDFKKRAGKRGKKEDKFGRYLEESRVKSKKIENEWVEDRKQREATALVPEIRVHGPVSGRFFHPRIFLFDLAKIACEISNYVDERNLEFKRQYPSPSIDIKIKEMEGYDFPLYNAMPEVGIIILSTENIGFLHLNLKDSSDRKFYFYAGLKYTNQINDMGYFDVGPFVYGIGLVLAASEMLKLYPDEVVLGPPEQIELPPTHGNQEETGKYLAALTLQGLLESDIYKEKNGVKQLIVLGKPVFDTSSGYLPYNRVLDIKKECIKAGFER